MKARLIRQINESPEPLRSYIHEMETIHGEVAHMIQDIFGLREQVKYLTLLLRESELEG